MKAKLFVAALATLAFASCSETETVEMPSSAAIKFDNVFVGNAVRGVVTTESLQSFKVFGGFDASTSNVFDNVEITKRESDGQWGPAEGLEQYWQAGKQYKFQAYASAQNGVASENGVNFTDYTVKNAAIAGQEDLLISNVVSVEGKASGNTAVSLQFRHALAMAKFTIKSDFADNVTLSVKNVTINGVATKGNYTNAGANGTWAKASDPTAENFNFGDINSIVGATGESTAEMIILPQDLSGLQVTFTVSASGALSITDQPITVTLAGANLTEGQRVNFVATITPENITPGGMEEIVFNPSVTNWDDTPFADNSEGTVNQ